MLREAAPADGILRLAASRASRSASLRRCGHRRPASPPLRRSEARRGGSPDGRPMPGGGHHPHYPVGEPRRANLGLVSGMKRTLVLLGIALALHACVTSSPGQEVSSVGPTETTTPPPATPVPASPSRTEHCHEDFGICVSVPPAWTISWDPLRDGTIGDILLAGSFSFGHLPECRPIPSGEVLTALSEVLPREQAGREYGPGRIGSRPLTSTRPRFARAVTNPWPKPFRFLSADRALYARIMAGPEFRTDVRTDADAVHRARSLSPCREGRPPHHPGRRTRLRVDRAWSRDAWSLFGNVHGGRARLELRSANRTTAIVGE